MTTTGAVAAVASAVAIRTRMRGKDCDDSRRVVDVSTLSPAQSASSQT